jgi:hypothetical protein
MASTQKESAETFSVASRIFIAVRAIAWARESYAFAPTGVRAYPVSFPQVGPTGVGCVAVRKIDFKLRPPAGHVEPSKAARLVQLSVYANLLVSSTPASSSNAASNGAAARRHPPAEFSGCRVISQDFAQSVSR